MARATANGIEIEYELSGPSDKPVLLMIHGVGAQLVRWPPRLCDALIAAGFQLLRFDNRDVGLSSHMNEAAVPQLAQVLEARREGREPELPYALSDLARDTAGLLDTLGIAQAHVLGVSLGGMVAQVLAIEHPARVRSLAIFMSNSGNAEMPGSRPDAIDMLSRRAPNPSEDREAYLQHQVELNRVVGSPGYPTSEAELRRMASLSAQRSWNPLGAARQLAATRGASDRRAQLSELQVPTVVIHGVDDPLIPVECGADIARAIKGSWLLEVNGMGHDLPEPLFSLFVNMVSANCLRASPIG